MLATSEDGGANWNKPMFVVDPVDPRVRAFDPCLWLDPQNRLWLFWSQSLDLRDGRFGVWAMVTEDADALCPAWSEPRRLEDGIMMNKPTVAANGDWHLPISIWPAGNPLWPEGKPHQPPVYFNLSERTGAWDVISRDQGTTFQPVGKADDLKNRLFDEHMLVQRRDDSWWMLSRTKDGIWENISTDDGHHWAPGRLSDIPHINSRFFIRRLASGNLLLVRHGVVPEGSKHGAPRSHLTAYLSEDDGLTWKGGLLMDERVGVSYPDGTQMPDGTIHIIYDFNRGTDKQILLATFTEADVMAGEWASPQARQKRLINQATGDAPEAPAV